MNVNCGIIPQRRKLHKKELQKPFQSPFEFLAEYEFVCPKGGTPQYQGKNNCPKENNSQITVIQSSPRAGNISSSHQPERREGAENRALSKNAEKVMP